MKDEKHIHFKNNHIVTATNVGFVVRVIAAAKAAEILLLVSSGIKIQQQKQEEQDLSTGYPGGYILVQRGREPTQDKEKEKEQENKQEKEKDNVINGNLLLPTLTPPEVKPSPPGYQYRVPTIDETHIVRRFPDEPHDQFAQRQAFFEAIRHETGDARAVTFSMIWRNLKFLNCRYGAVLEKSIYDLEKTYCLSKSGAPTGGFPPSLSQTPARVQAQAKQQPPHSDDSTRPYKPYHHHHPQRQHQHPQRQHQNVQRRGRGGYQPRGGGYRGNGYPKQPRHQYPYHQNTNQNRHYDQGSRSRSPPMSNQRDRSRSRSPRRSQYR